MNVLNSKIPFLIALMVSLTACAQGGPHHENQMGAGPGQGMGQGKGHGMMLNDENTEGWSMMSEQERAEHYQRMMSMRSYEDCMAYVMQHHQQMQERASAQGKTLHMPQANMCEHMREMGMFQ